MCGSFTSHRWWQLLCPAVPQLCHVCGREQSHTSSASIKNCEENNDTLYLEAHQEVKFILLLIEPWPCSLGAGQLRLSWNAQVCPG